MASYPNSVPALGTLSGATYPQTSHVNNPADEIVAIATELGTNPHVIADNVTPGATPASVGVYLDMLATIFKTVSGQSNWYYSAVPARHCLVSHGGGAVVPAEPTSVKYLGPGQRGFKAENLARYVSTTPYKVLLHTLRIELLTAVPSGVDDNMFVTFMKNGAQVLALTIPLGTPAGIVSPFTLFNPGYAEVSFAVNDTISWLLTLDSGNAGPQVGSISVQVIQNG